MFEKRIYDTQKKEEGKFGKNVWKENYRKINRNLY